MQHPRPELIHFFIPGLCKPNQEQSIQHSKKRVFPSLSVQGGVMNQLGNSICSASVEKSDMRKHDSKEKQGKHDSVRVGMFLGGIVVVIFSLAFDSPGLHHRLLFWLLRIGLDR